MTTFVDASAIVAIIGHEPGWGALADALDAADRRLWSAVARWESTAALRIRLKKSAAEADAAIRDFASENRFSLVTIGQEESDLAIDAFARFGKGTGHAAQLNMGDCFAYTCAKAVGARLLYKGDGFAHTDLA